MSGFVAYWRCSVCGSGCHTIHRADGTPTATRIVLVDGVGQPPVPHAYHDDEKLDAYWGGHDAEPEAEPLGDALRRAFERWSGTGLRDVETVDPGDLL